jgi:hypothetical protein
MPVMPVTAAEVRPAEVQQTLFAAEPGRDVRSEPPGVPVARSAAPRRPVRPSGTVAAWDAFLDGQPGLFDVPEPELTPFEVAGRAAVQRHLREREPEPRDPFGDGLPRLDGLCPCAACALMLAAWREREALRRGGTVGALMTRRSVHRP